MTKEQKQLDELLNEQSQLRQRGLELATLSELSDEQRTELDKLEKRGPDVERQIRACRALIAAESDTEVSEVQPDEKLAQIASKVEMRAIVKAAVTRKPLQGAEKEYYDELELEEGTIPLSLFEPAPSVEMRAPTPAPGTVNVTLAPLAPAVFADSIAARLMIQMPQVSPGSFAAGRLSTSLTAAPKSKGDPAEATAAAFDITTVTPKRISARLELRVEDLASVGSNFEAVLRQNIGQVMSDALDTQVLTGDGAAPNLNGLINQLDDPTEPTAVSNFDSFAKSFGDQVDGLWAANVREIAIAAGVETYRFSASLFQRTDSYAGETSAAAYAEMNTGGYMAHARIPAAENNKQIAIVVRKGRPGLQRAVMPVWGNITIDDIYTGAASGLRSVTMHLLCGDVIIVQPAAYAQVEYQLA